MSVLIRINGIPLFSNIEGALLWGEQYGLNGYHTHIITEEGTYEGQTGYMAGGNHEEVIEAFKLGVRQTATIPTTTQVITTAIPSSPTTGGGGY